MRRTLTVVVLAIATTLSLGAVASFAHSSFDFGVWRDKQLADKSNKLFGVDKPLEVSSTQSISQAQALAHPTDLVDAGQGAEGARRHHERSGGRRPDLALAEQQAPEVPHRLQRARTRPIPGLVRIELATGNVSTIVTGTTDCDPTRLTPWGTIVFGEEDGADGRVYELIDPIHTTGVQLDRTTGTFSGGTGAQNLVTRNALGTYAFEGLGILPDGTTYISGDDSGFGPKNGGPGDAYFKFVPTNPFHGTDPITDLSQSPYASGEVYGLRVGPTTKYGQGREFGTSQWIPLPHSANPNLEAEGLAAGLSGYYRPEDLEIDPVALAQRQRARLRSRHRRREQPPLRAGRLHHRRHDHAGRGQHRDARDPAVRVRRHEPGRQHARQRRVPAGHATTWSSTRTVRRRSSRRTTTTCGAACPTGPTRTSCPTAARVSRRSTI